MRVIFCFKKMTIPFFLLGVYEIDNLSSHFTEFWIKRSGTQVALYDLGLNINHKIIDAEPNARLNDTKNVLERGR